MYLFKFLGKVKKSKSEQEEIFCIAATKERALDKISNFSHNAVYVSETKLKGWDKYVE
jgi:hypothetical protein